MRSCDIPVPPTRPVDPSAPPAPERPVPPPRRRSGVARVWWVVRYPIGLGLGALAIWAVAGKSQELSGATSYLAHLRWPWVALAALAEAVSYLSFAVMQRRLLHGAGVEVPVGSMTGITVAGNAIQVTLPAGIVLASAFAFRQYRRYGADDVVAGWVLVTMTIVSFASLAFLATVGLAFAVGSGSALDLVTVIIGVAVVAGLLVSAWANREALLARAGHLVRLSQRISRRPIGDADALVEGWIARLGAITPSRGDWAMAAIAGLGNWLADLSCLVLAFLAVGTGVPWQALLLAYGAGQLATNLPITPGGLGVVEGSLTVALVAFGGDAASTVAAVLVYRLLSFWLVLPVGWGAWGYLSWSARRQPLLRRGLVEGRA
ncbi:MAG: lysylphosphatidylglycerol synthase transmembrane domain-containing protein [Acidimicrobiales bacterium]